MSDYSPMRIVYGLPTSAIAVARQNSDLLLNHGNEPVFGRGCVRAIPVIFDITRTKSRTIRAIGIA
jgi:hypothetical protein